MRKIPVQVRLARQIRQRRALAKAVGWFGSKSALAQAMGVSYQAVQGWEAGGVPIDRCARLETLVGGRAQCEELNEDWARVTARPCRRQPEAA